MSEWLGRWASNGEVGEWVPREVWGSWRGQQMGGRTDGGMGN